MRKLATSLAALALVATPLALVQAQDTPTKPGVPPAITAPAPEVILSGSGFIRQQEPGQQLSESVVGAKIYDGEGKAAGEVTDLLLAHDGRVLGVVVSHGGFLGIGDKLVAVPWERLTRQTGMPGAFNLQMSEAELKATPPFLTLARATDEAERQRLRGEAERAAPTPAPSAVPAQ